MYTQMLSLVRAIAAWPELRPTLAEPTGQTAPPGQPVPSVLTALEGVRRQAEFFHRTTVSQSAAASDSEVTADAEMEATRHLAAQIMETAAEIESCRALADVGDLNREDPNSPSRSAEGHSLPASCTPSHAGTTGRGSGCRRDTGDSCASFLRTVPAVTGVK